MLNYKIQYEIARVFVMDDKSQRKYTKAISDGKKTSISPRQKVRVVEETSNKLARV